MIGNVLALRTRSLWPLLVVVAGLLAYSNSFRGGFFWGDFGSIPENPTIRHLWPIWRPLSPPHADQIAFGLTVEGRPILNLSLAINYALGGYNVWGYHALNLTVHLLAGLTLFGIVRRTLLQLQQESRVLLGPAPITSGPTLRDRFGAAANELALAVAVLWTVHPLQTESVTYIIQRAESIMGLFYLLTLYCFIRGAESRRAWLWYSLSVAACALGMATKEVMMTAPVMVMLYDRAFLARSLPEAWRRHGRLYLALGSTWILQGVVLAAGGNIATALKNARHVGLTQWEYLATQPGVILYYLRLAVWPSPLRLVYQWPIAKTWMSIVPPVIVVGILLLAVAWVWRRNPAWGFVGVWFFLILAPSSSLMPGTDALAEHRMYLPLAAVVVLVVIGLYSLTGRQSLALVGALAIGLGFLTWRRNQDYRCDPHHNLAVALQKAGRLQEAIAEYELALPAESNNVWFHYNFGTALQQVGRPAEAIDQWQQAIGIKPDYAEAHNNLGSALAQMGRLDEAVQHYQLAVRAKPDFVDAYYDLGNAMVRMGRAQEAVTCYEQAVRLKPDFALAYGNLGVALERAGRVQEAAQQYERALQLDPDYAEAHYNLGLVLWRAGKIGAAAEHWESVVRINPAYAQAHNNLGGALMQLSRVPEAIEQFEAALQIEPDMAEAHYNLGTALERSGKLPEATAQYEQALRLKPDYAEALNHLDQLRGRAPTSRDER
jgi:tetratricopeptide (TPR) repeat protein